jgi:hypothetical protein
MPPLGGIEASSLIWILSINIETVIWTLRRTCHRLAPLPLFWAVASLDSSWRVRQEVGLLRMIFWGHLPCFYLSGCCNMQRKFFQHQFSFHSTQGPTTNIHFPLGRLLNWGSSSTWSILLLSLLQKGVRNCSSVAQSSLTLSLMSWPIWIMIHRKRSISESVTSGSGEGQSSRLSRYWWWYLLVSSTSSWIVPVKNNMNTQSGMESLFTCGASLRFIRTPPAMLLSPRWWWWLHDFFVAPINVFIFCAAVRIRIEYQLPFNFIIFQTMFHCHGKM